jgi:hypothetical protein
MSRGVVQGAAATVAVVAVGSSLLAGRASEDAFDTEAIAAADPIRFDVFASGRGVRLGIDATYPGDRQLSGGRVTIDGDVDEGLDFWSESTTTTSRSPIRSRWPQAPACSSSER